MRRLRAWMIRLSAAIRLSGRDRDLESEIESHLALHTHDNLRAGMTTADARRAALVAFGGVESAKEAYRDRRGLPLVDQLAQDLRQTVRMFAHAKAFYGGAVLTLALGIGATTVIFAVVSAVLLRPPAFADPARLMLLFSVNDRAHIGQIRASPLDFQDWRQQAGSFDGMAACSGTGFTFTGTGEPEMAIGQLVSEDFFRVLGVPPAAGRTFLPEEFAPGHEHAIVLTHALWLRRFGGDRSAIGRTTTVNGQPYTIVGVMPPAFVYPGKRYQLFVPLPTSAGPGLPPVNRDSHYLQVIARLRPGVSVQQARTEMDAIAARLAAAFPDSDAPLGARVLPLSEESVRDVRPAMLLLLGAVGCVVLIACTNVTSLLLARANTRKREVSIRAALGASRWRLIRQFLTETIVLYAAGATAGLALANWGLRTLVSLDPGNIPRLAEASIDRPVLAVTCVVSFVTSIIFGLAPAAQAARTNVSEALNAGGRSGSTGGSHETWRAGLVVAEVALAVVLLVGAGLVLKSFVRLGDVNPGFEADDQVTFGVVMSARRYPESDRQIQFVRRAAAQLSGMPGVRSAGMTTHLPFTGQNLENSFGVEGLVLPPGDESPIAGMRGVAGDYFAALGVALKAGRTFTAADRDGSPPVAIVNEAFARQYLPGRNPVGRRLKEGGTDSPAPWRVVVGVVADIHHSGPAAEARPEVNLPYEQLDPGFLNAWSRGVTFVVRGEDSVRLTPRVRDEMRRLDPAMALTDVQTMSSLAHDVLSRPRFRTATLGAFAALAVVLATVGIFGVLSYFVTQRTKEIGVRLALGATGSDILSLVVGRGVRLVGLGIAVGLAIAVPLARSMRTLLFEVTPGDLATFIGVGVGLLLVAVLASYLPARRAMRLDPTTALRTD